MPISTPHPEYDTAAPDWLRCRDAMRGRRAVRDGGTSYLPWSEALTGPDYQEYADRAVWYGATERTVRGLSGAVTRKSTAIDVPTQVEAHLVDVDLAGTDIDSFLLQLVQEQLLVSRACIEVTMSAAPGGEQRPYWTLWKAEDILSWREERIDGDMTVTLLVLRATAWQPDDKDPYRLETATTYRELALMPVGAGWAYRERVFAERAAAAGSAEAPGLPRGWVLLAESWPQRRGELLPFLPVVPVGACTGRWAVEKPALLDLVDLNLAHWRNSADYEAALACIKPVYALFGFPDSTAIVLGSRRALTSELAAGHAEILQGGDPVGLRAALTEKEHGMAVLGARLLESQPDAAETATAVRMRHSGDEASLRTIADAMGQGAERALKFHAWWLGLDNAEIAVTPNKDYVSAALEPDQIRAYMELVNNGRISYETFYALLQSGEIARPGITVQEELDQIETETEADLKQLTGPPRVPGAPPTPGVTPPALAPFAAATQQAATQPAATE
jgi:hypothetical protein